MPTGGVGNYRYQWERSADSDCDDNDFVPISGATSIDYSVPAGTPTDICFRRVVRAGGCISTSNELRVPTASRTTPPAPTVALVQPTCTTGTGTITITSPAPAAGISYSINGTTYTNTTGIFTNLSPGTYPVTARYPSGCASPVQSVTLNPLPALTGTVSPSTSGICAGGSQLLTATGGGTYQWFRNNVAITNATSATYIATESGTYRADITNGFCRGTTGNATVTVTPLPSGTVTPATIAVCEGATATLTATGGGTYQWFRNGAAITGATSATYNATVSGTYTAEITAGGCKATATGQSVVTVNPIPSGTISPSTLTLCSGGGSGTLTATGGTSYQWRRNGTAITGATASTLTVTEAGTYTVSITANGCTGTATNSAVVTVGATPSGTISPASGTICAGTPVLLQVGGGNSYQWYRNGTAIAGATNATYSATQAGTYTADITSGSCTARATNSAVITTASNPVGNITPAAASICPGGSQQLTANGGTGYQWLRNGVAIAGATATTYNAVEAGVYGVIITNNGCSAPAANTATIAQAVLPVSAITPASATICEGSSQVLTATGGSRYQWFRNGVLIQNATAATYSATQTGVYAVDIFTPENCRTQATNNATVTVNPLPTGNISPATAAICAGGNVNLSANGGSSYQWFRNGTAITNATGATFTATEAGTYTVDIFNGGCRGTATNNSVVTVNALPTGSITPGTLTICSNSSGTLTVTGGVSYQWYRDGVQLAGATANTYEATEAGTYAADIINANGCIARAGNTAAVTQTAAPSGAITPATGVICGTAGPVTLTANGGSSYQWYRDDAPINGATGATLTATVAGTYAVDIIAGGCTARASNTAVLTQGQVPSGTITPGSATLCAGTTRTLTATGGGSYQWFRDGQPIAGATAATYVASAGGVYSVLISNGTCTAPASNEATITAAPAPNGNITPATAAFCQGGSQVLTVTGGASYQWFRNGVAITGATGNTFTATQTGTYSAEIISSSGCRAQAANTATVTVTQIPNGAVSPETATFCAGSSVTLTATGGTGYQWFRDGQPIAGATSATYQATQQGVYTADVIDGPCRSRSGNSSTVTVGNVPTGTISPSSVSICAGGSATLTVSGGITYQWFRNGVPINGANGASFVATLAGTYSVEIIGSANCRGRATNEAVVLIGALPTGTISPASGVVCAGGPALTLTATGGTGYQWYRDGAPIGGATSATYAATQPGTYTADIRSGACVGRSSNASVLTAGALPNGSISPASASICPGGSQVLTASGGGTYQWQLDGTAIAGATSANFTATTPGVYSVLINNGTCTAPAANTATVQQASAPAGVVTPATATVCPGGSVTLTTTGGTAFQWYKDGVVIAGATGATYEASAGGTYTADIRSGSCTARTTAGAVIGTGTSPVGTISPASVLLCPGGNAVLSVTGGTSYQWFRNGVAIAGATGNTVSVTQAGTYSATIANGNCSGPAGNMVAVTVAAPVTFTTSVAQPSCSAGTGSINVSAPAGGSGAGYTYSVNNGVSFQSTGVFLNLAPGVYQVVVRDNGDCRSAAESITINAFVSTLAAAANISPATCSSPGAATITATGGTAPYRFSLNGGALQTSNQFSGLAAGAYTVNVRDAAGCTTELQFTVAQSASTLTATVATTDPLCAQTTGSVTVQASGGIGTYSYRLDNGNFQAGNSFSGVSVGNHRVTVRDGAGCTVEVSFTIRQVGTIPTLVVTNPAPLCDGTTANLQAAAVTAGSDAGLVLSYWQNAAATTALPTPAAVGAGTYYIKATNAAGCTAVQPVIVRNYTGTPGRIAQSGTPVICQGDTLVLTASTGTAYQWFRNDTLVAGANTATFNATLEGTYSVVINDGTCAVPAANKVEVQLKVCVAAPEGKVFVPTAFTPNGNGQNDRLRPLLYNVTQLNYFRVYNRWGQQVYETAQIGQGWDGTLKGSPQPTETYTWILECRDASGNVIRKSGRTLLIR